jgi:hypothetical protein
MISLKGAPADGPLQPRCRKSARQRTLADAAYASAAIAHKSHPGVGRYPTTPGEPVTSAGAGGMRSGWPSVVSRRSNFPLPMTGISSTSTGRTISGWRAAAGPRDHRPTKRDERIRLGKGAFHDLNVLVQMLAYRRRYRTSHWYYYIIHQCGPAGPTSHSRRMRRRVPSRRKREFVLQEPATAAAHPSSLPSLIRN